MHTLDEFENITNEVIKNPKKLTDITKETVELVEQSLEKTKKDSDKSKEYEIEL